jgi:gluconate 2-dehydrogenase gamma chain
MSDDQQSQSRRRLIKSLVFVPMAAGAAGALHGGLNTAGAAGTNAPEGKPDAYTPKYFTADGSTA